MTHDNDNNPTFKYTDERFADIQMLRYRLDGFNSLTLKQKQLVYCLTEAALWGRDITFHQFGRYNLRIRQLLETIYLNYKGPRTTPDFLAFEEYLKRIWFANGIYHHYGNNKFQPRFSQQFLTTAAQQTGADLTDELIDVIFNPLLLPTKVNKSDGQDLVATSAVNFYENLTQQEVEAFYNTLKEKDAEKQKTTKNANSDTPYNETSDTPIYGPPSYGLNSTLVKRGTTIIEDTWRIGGRYGKTLERIVHWLTQAMDHAESNHQRKVIALLIDYYRTGNLQTFNQYCIQWVADHSAVDFINGFIEVYDDPLGMRGTWEGLVEYIDTKGTERTQIISSNAQWFEDHSPVDPRFKKSQVSGVSAAVICAAMLAGAEYPATAIGINLPNADWIRAQHGSKSITISNIINAYNEASRNSGFQDEFVIDSATKALIARYGDITDTLHTDLHECLGHGSGQLLPGIDPDALKAYGNTIEEARADLFALYYLADPKLTDLGLTPDHQAYQAAYYSYILNGMLTQLARIAPGNNIEEAHMRNRALIARWCYAQGKNRTKNSDNGKRTIENVIELVTRNNKTYVQINDYEQLRALFATLLAEIQRIKSCGDYEAARQLVERYAVTVPTDLHNEILTRYNQLGIPPYKGFINPTLTPLYDHHGNITDIIPTYNETYAQQMLRYSRDYSTEAV